MIEFKIVASPDRSQQATYQHLSTEITFGQNDGDMILDDPLLAPLQLKIFRQGSGYMVQNLADDIEVRLNGRALQEAMPIKEKDNLNLGRTVISITRLDALPLQPPPPYEYPHANSRFAAGTKEKAILDALAAQAQKESGASPAPSAAMPKPPPPPGVKPPPPPRNP
jgi:hypothetical protein